MTPRHPPAVYAAARDGFRRVLAVLEDLPWAVTADEAAPAAMGAVRMTAKLHLWHLRLGIPPPRSAAEDLACILGVSAVPAVLRVRARRAARE